MEEPHHTPNESVSVASSSTTITPSTNAPSSSTPSTSSLVQEEENHGNHHHPQRQHRRSSIRTYRMNISISDGGAVEMSDDVWSCLVVLATFWFFASMTVILGFYGSVNFQLGPNCSSLIESNRLFVQSIKTEEVDDQKPGPMLYGFYRPPPLDVEISWTQTHNAFVTANFHEEWAHYLNKGSRVEILYHVKSSTPSPLSLVIAQGRESLIEWIEDPSYPNSTLSWHTIYGSGKIQQEISMSSNYYIAVGNFNTEDVEVELKFNMNAFIYNTTKAYYKCSLGNNRLCSLKLFLLGANSALLTSPPPTEGVRDDEWFIKLSYGPRWLTYFFGSGAMTALILLTFRFCNIFDSNSVERTQFQTNEISEQSPLLVHKDDDSSSWGSSYDSFVSNDDADLEEWLPGALTEGNPTNEGENNNNTRRLCVICYDDPRDCFFLPCGHCAACFTCGTRIVEASGTCPICRRKMKRVRKIFTV